MNNNTKLAVACIQMRSGTDIDRNISALEDMVREAAGLGARYIQTPEMTGILQRNPKLLFSTIGDNENNKVFAKASKLAHELGIWLHIGSTAVLSKLQPDGTGKAKNQAGLFAPDGTRTASYDKIHMFDVDLDSGESWRESKVYEPGDTCIVTEIDGIRTGLSICYDLRFPHIYRDQAKAGAMMLTCPSSFTRQTGEAHWHTLLKSRAIENGAFVVAAAQGGIHEDGRETYGHSLIVDPWGKTVAELDHDQPGVLVAEMDFDIALRARTKIPSLINERPYQLDGVAAGEMPRKAIGVNA